MSFERELAVARAAARAGAAVAMQRYMRAPSARRKQDGSWVTEADEEAEREIRRQVADAFPDHNVFGEEGGSASAGGGDPDEGAPTWIVDPVDGTSNYMSGVPIWATLVGLEVDGERVVGAVDAPALGERYDAARGQGARFNGAPMAVEPLASLADAFVVHGSDKGFRVQGHGQLYEALRGRAQRVRGLGDFWGHMLVARGAAHAMVEAHPGLKPWDVAALEPIVAEAGGRQSNLAGAPWTPGEPLLSSCGGPLHDELLALAAADRR